MTLSDDLMKLAQRAKAAEDKAKAAWNQVESDLQLAVDGSRAQAEDDARNLRAQAAAGGAAAQSSWATAQSSWDAHVAKVRSDIDKRKVEWTAATAEDQADWAESDADLAVGYAYNAVEEAEYAVLNAILARKKAGEAEMAIPR